jgi:hypothetical protein
MNVNIKRYNSLLLVIPVILAFLVALIPTLKYQWPLSWDVLFHIHIAQVYASYGLVFTDPLFNLPFGQIIGYPPLFNLLIASLGFIFKYDYFQIARFLQPLLLAFIVLSVSYTTYKFYGYLAGISAGFLMLSTYLLRRLVLSIPENMALIFLPFSVYFYYLSIDKNNLKFALISGIFLGVVALIHQGAALCLFLIITFSTLVIGILYKDINILRNYGVCVVIGLAVALIWWGPAILNSISQGATGAGGGIITSMTENIPLSASKYAVNFGPLILIFAFLGGIISFKRRYKKDLVILSWIASMFLLSVSYLFGINVVSDRLLVYLVIPLTMIGGFGLSYSYYYFKEKQAKAKRPLSQWIRWAFLMTIFMLSIFYGVVMVENPKIAQYNSQTKFGSVPISPPTTSEVELAQWFDKNGDKNKSVAISNYYSSIFLVARTEQPIAGDPLFYLTGKAKKSDFLQNKIGYIVFDKRLTFSSTNGTSYEIVKYGQFVFYNKEVPRLDPNLAMSIYENHDYIVYELD